jgi:hypothetical protein
LYIKTPKYEFHKTTTEYLEILVMPEGSKMDFGKVSVVKQWPIPQQLEEIHAFIEFGNFF